MIILEVLSQMNHIDITATVTMNMLMPITTLAAMRALRFIGSINGFNKPVKKRLTYISFS